MKNPLLGWVLLIPWLTVISGKNDGQYENRFRSRGASLFSGYDTNTATRFLPTYYYYDHLVPVSLRQRRQRQFTESLTAPVAVVLQTGRPRPATVQIKELPPLPRTNSGFFINNDERPEPVFNPVPAVPQPVPTAPTVPTVPTVKPATTASSFARFSQFGKEMFSTFRPLSPTPPSQPPVVTVADTANFPLPENRFVPQVPSVVTPVRSFLQTVELPTSSVNGIQRSTPRPRAEQNPVTVRPAVSTVSVTETPRTLNGLFTNPTAARPSAQQLRTFSVLRSSLLPGSGSTSPTASTPITTAATPSRIAPRSTTTPRPLTASVFRVPRTNSLNLRSTPGSPPPSPPVATATPTPSRATSQSASSAFAANSQRTTSSASSPFFRPRLGATTTASLPTSSRSSSAITSSVSFER